VIAIAVIITERAGKFKRGLLFFKRGLLFPTSSPAPQELRAEAIFAE